MTRGDDQSKHGRPYSLGEEIANAVTHGVGAALSVAALVILIGIAALWGDGWHLASAIVYGVTMFLLYTASTLYHAITHPRARHVLKIIDHASIYLLIAGSYTPFCLIAFQGFWRWGLLAIMWKLAVAGIVTKIFIINTPRWLTAGLYILMGWLSVSAAGEF